MGHYEVEKQLVGPDRDFSVIDSTGNTNVQFGGFPSSSTVRVPIRAFGTTGPDGAPTSPDSKVAEIIVRHFYYAKAWMRTRPLTASRIQSPAATSTLNLGDPRKIKHILTGDPFISKA